MGRISSPQELEKYRNEIHRQKGSQAAPDHGLWWNGMSCVGMSCRSSMPLKRFFRRRPKNNGVDLRVTGCHGFCERGPLVVIHPQKFLYQRVKPEMPEIFEETVLNGKIIEYLLYDHPVTGEKIVSEEEVPFYKKQMRIIFGNNGSIDPTWIEDYIAVGGYRALPRPCSR